VALCQRRSVLFFRLTHPREKIFARLVFGLPFEFNVAFEISARETSPPTDGYTFEGDRAGEGRSVVDSIIAENRVLEASSVIEVRAGEVGRKAEHRAAEIG
jgi:hypothetical protein